MKTLSILLLSLAFACHAGAQGRGSKTSGKRPHTAKSSKPAQLPSWAGPHHYDAREHVYFPDYYTYYDPQRGGYVYWDNGRYSFSPSVPPYLEKVDLGKSRIQVLKGLSLDLHPEQNYPNYMKLYPAEHTYDKVPVPVIGPHQQ